MRFLPEAGIETGLDGNSPYYRLVKYWDVILFNSLLLVNNVATTFYMLGSVQLQSVDFTNDITNVQTIRNI